MKRIGRHFALPLYREMGKELAYMILALSSFLSLHKTFKVPK
jgi:hypothetical protein